MEIEDIMMRNQELSMDNERLRRQLDEAIRERDQARGMYLGRISLEYSVEEAQKAREELEW